MCLSILYEDTKKQQCEPAKGAGGVGVSDI